MAPEPLIKNPFFVKIILWQHQLKQKISELIQNTRSDGNLKPMFFLIGLAFLYGFIHAAGPGHGKVVAMSYVLSHKATIPGGIFFGFCFAVIHALSGVIGVLGLHYIIQAGVSDTLESVTSITQIISYGLITLLGISILIKHGYALLKPPIKDESEKTNDRGIIIWAITVGLVPCPAVVMVMLFCMSMDALALGLLLAACISMGMATTISFVVISMIIGKTGVLNIISKKFTTRLEVLMGLFSGAAISIFGGIFFLSAMIAMGH